MGEVEEEGDEEDVEDRGLCGLLVALRGRGAKGAPC